MRQEVLVSALSVGCATRSCGINYFQFPRNSILSYNLHRFSRGARAIGIGPVSWLFCKYLRWWEGWVRTASPPVEYHLSVQAFKISQGGDALRNCSRQLVVIQAPVPERVRNLSRRTLWMTHNVSNWTNCPIESGIGPLNWFSYSSLGFCSVCQCNDFGSSYKLQRLVKEERVGGMGPSSLFFCNHLCSVQVSVERVCDIPMTSLTLSPIAWRNQRNQESTLSIPLRPGCWWFRELGLFREINRHTLTGWEVLEERFRATSPVRCSWKSAVTITLQIVLQLFSAPLGLIWITYLFHVFCAFYNFLQRDWKPGTF